jgi:hypothetical protein
MKKITLLLALLVASISFSQVSINEIDSDQTGTDMTEFVELLSDNPSQSLDGLILVFFNGNNAVNGSYNVIDLDGFTTDANGFFLVANDGFPNADIQIGPDNIIQNGTDAVAIYQASASSFPADTPPTTSNLIDAVIYETSDGVDADLQMDLGLSVQYDENGNGMKDTESLQRQGDDSFCPSLPTPKATNASCVNCPLDLSNIMTTCDAETSGIDTVTATIDFTGGGTETYTLTLDAAGTISGDDPTTDATGTITISGIEENTTIVLTVTSASCDFTQNINAQACAQEVDVANIAALRASPEDVDYTLTGEAILTYQQDFRGQKFIEDATGAILIDDNADIITTTYAIGDGITGLRGTLSSFNGMMQFVPLEDPGAASSTGNPVVAQDVTANALNANPNDYESEYVRILNAAIDNSVLATWDTGETYDMSTGSGDYVFRTSFFDADYIGTDVPTSNANVSGIITERNNGDYFITARNTTDIDDNLSVESNTINGLSVYPNPAQDIVTISTGINAEKNVVIFDITGKTVLDITTTSSINVGKLTSGLYIMQITENNAVATTKLIIR